MTKSDLINAVSKAVKLSKSATRKTVDATFATLTRTIKRDKRIQVPGFGTFTVRSRKPRTGRNPKTGEVIHMKASRTVGFKPSPNLKKGL
jgi:DNA-binding protein HU-beta